jgi:hypothetical protein
LKKIKLLLKKVVYFSILGKRCNICNSSVRKMVPHGFYFSVLTDLNVVGGQRTNSAKCPFCYSTERERLLFFYYDK